MQDYRALNLGVAGLKFAVNLYLSFTTPSLSTYKANAYQGNSVYYSGYFQ